MTYMLSNPLPPSPDGKMIGDAAFQAVSQLLQEATGIVLSEGKKGLVVSRLSRRLRDLGLKDFNSYCEFLSGAQGPSELQTMISLLTTNVTRFFREPHHFNSLSAEILPRLIARAKSGGRVRIWSAGCATGEEAFSIAMCILEAFPQAASANVRILATDVDRKVVELGKAGRFQLGIEEFTDHPVLKTYLSRSEGSDTFYEAVPALKEMVQFGQLNLLDPWPMRGKFDVIFCRNVVIYFSANTQQNLWPRFADMLCAGGHLMIGHSERVTGRASERLRSVGVTHYELKGGEVRT